MYQSLKDDEQEFVLATIIDTSGSTYRKAGARLLITKAGNFYGLLGGGCFESDLLEHALQVFVSKQTNTLFYDMRGPEDLVWGLGLGCNGAVKIRLEYLSKETDFTPLSVIEKGLDSKQECVVATVCESDHPSILSDQHYLLSTDQEIDDDQTIPGPFLQAAVETLATGTSSLLSIDVDGHQIQTFMSCVMPPTRLVIIGGGPDCVPVIKTASLLGWDITVIDYRDNYSNPENFPEANNVINSTPEQLDSTIDITNVDAVVLMTHKYEYDLRYLKNLINTSIPYIGLLGPTARKNELLRLLEDDITIEKNERIYGPVGMNIGGELPEEIALSLIAEIQAVLNHRSGGHLSRHNMDKENSNKFDDLSIVILAAGGSSRFGALKQLLEFNGKSFLKRTVETALELQDKEVLVVHGPKATKCQREISPYEVVNVVNNNWETGMSSSLKLAVNSVAKKSEAILVLLCDQPLINTKHLHEIIKIWRENPDKIVASNYADTVGVPAIIPKKYFDAIKKLTGDVGAKKLIDSFSENLLTIHLPEAEFDIDTKKDFTDLLGRKLA